MSVHIPDPLPSREKEGEMTGEELAAKCAAARESGRDDFVLKVYRKAGMRSEKMRVLPGVTGKLVQWGDGSMQFPSVVFVKVVDVERALAKSVAAS